MRLSEGECAEVHIRVRQSRDLVLDIVGVRPGMQSFYVFLFCTVQELCMAVTHPY